MAYANVGELKAAIADWLNREDLTSVIPEFIDLAQIRINKDRRFSGYDSEFAYTQTVIGASQVNPVSTPAPLDEIRTLIVDDKVIPYVTNEAYYKEREDRKYTDGVWTYIEGEPHLSTWELPTGTSTATDSQVVTLLGYDDGNMDTLVDASSGWIMDHIPDAMLYACLTEASIYLRDFEGVQLYQARYDELADKFQKDSRRRAVVGGLSVQSVGGDYKFERRQ